MQVIPVLGGRYRLGPEIGSGGMGAVHRAWDERFQREVAIKVLRAGSDGVERERLRREAQYLAHLDHPNLVAVLDAGSDRLRSGETVWFAMELVHGPDLRTVIRRDGALGGAAVRRVLAGLLAALGALHEAGVVHRDLKPGNVLLTGDPATSRWEVKLVDLGIAQHIATQHLTSTGQVVGTAAYLSPEQVTGRRIGPPTDVYALGLLAVEALTGRIAFPGRPAESAAARLVRAPDLPDALSAPWRRLLSAMTSLDPDDRPSVAALTDLVQGLPDRAEAAESADIPIELMPVAPSPSAVPERSTAVLPAVARRRSSAPHPARRHLLAGACLLLAVVGAGGWMAALGGDGRPSAEAVVPRSSAPPVSAVPRSSPTTSPSAAPRRATATPRPTAVATSAAASRAAAAVRPGPSGSGPGPRAPGTAHDRAKRAEEAAQRIIERIRERGHRDTEHSWQREHVPSPHG